MKLNDDTLWSTNVRQHREINSERDDMSDDVLAHYPNGWFALEKENITLPSALAPGEIDCQSLEAFAMIKAEL